eukprot:4159004-Alexandrium_andersonii.AAC.1
MSGGPEAPPGLAPEVRPPPKRQRSSTSAPPTGARTPLVPIAGEKTNDGAPVRARPPTRDTSIRSQAPSFVSASSGQGGVPAQERLPRASSRPASLGPAATSASTSTAGVPV